jgi:hypothetical protein
LAILLKNDGALPALRPDPVKNEPVIFAEGTKWIRQVDNAENSFYKAIILRVSGFL